MSHYLPASPYDRYRQMSKWHLLICHIIFQPHHMTGTAKCQNGISWYVTLSASLTIWQVPPNVKMTSPDMSHYLPASPYDRYRQMSKWHLLICHIFCQPHHMTGTAKCQNGISWYVTLSASLTIWQVPLNVKMSPPDMLHYLPASPYDTYRQMSKWHLLICHIIFQPHHMTGTAKCQNGISWYVTLSASLTICRYRQMSKWHLLICHIIFQPHHMTGTAKCQNGISWYVTLSASLTIWQVPPNVKMASPDMSHYLPASPYDRYRQMSKWHLLICHIICQPHHMTGTAKCQNVASWYVTLSSSLTIWQVPPNVKMASPDMSHYPTFLEV